ncbi:MAG: hypothetical protein RL328_74, partial [Acidobacteriota bacterium]
NPYGNTEVVWPSFDPGRGLVVNGGVRAPTSPNNLYHPGARPARIAQWSVSMQREVIPNLIVEAAYLGNRGAWFYSPLLDTMAMNTLGGGQLERFGLDIHKAADRTLLGQTIGSTQAAARGFFSPYAGFPTSQPVGQAIRPVPQWGTTNPYLGPFRGNTWYDALQVQVTKRYSHNLDLTANFTYSHSMVLGVSSDSDFFVPGRPQVTDPFNRGINKQLNQLSPPLKTVISGTYTTPGLSHRDGLLRWANLVVKDWQVAAVLQYQSGELLTVPTSTNQLSGQLRINAPAAGLVGILNYNPWNFINGSPFFRPGLDPNGTFDPRAYDAAAPNNTSVLAGGLQANGTCSVAACAWSNPADGEWGVTAPYLEGFRWRRRPSEAFNFGRNFRMGRAVLNVRAEFQNIFNRLFYSAPTTANPNIAVSTTTQNGFRIPVGGYGVVNTLNGSGSSPRLGTLVARITF